MHWHSISLTRRWSRERTIQINTIGTTLLGLLLLGWMREAHSHRTSPAHIVFVSSRDHLYNNIDPLVRWSQETDDILRQVSCKDTGMAGFGKRSRITTLASFCSCTRSRVSVNWPEGRTASKTGAFEHFHPPSLPRLVQKSPSILTADAMPGC
jgi:hypothetical protein